MFNFLNHFFLDLKKKQLLIRNFNLWDFNSLNYKNYKVSSFLMVLISQFNFIDKQKLLIFSNTFSIDVFIKKLLINLVFLFFILLFLL